MRRKSAGLGERRRGTLGSNDAVGGLSSGSPEVLSDLDHQMAATSRGYVLLLPVGGRDPAATGCTKSSALLRFFLFEEGVSCYGSFAMQAGRKSTRRIAGPRKLEEARAHTAYAPTQAKEKSWRLQVSWQQAAATLLAHIERQPAAKPQRACVLLVGREASSERNQVTGTNDSGQRPWRQRYTHTHTAAGSLHGANLSAGAPAAAVRR